MGLRIEIPKKKKKFLKIFGEIKFFITIIIIIII